MEDENYINYIYDTYSNTILKIGYTYLKSTHLAEDILQEVLLKIIKKKIKIGDKTKEKYWIIRVTINMCKDYLKSSWYRKNVELDDNLSYLPKEQNELLTEVLKLPEKYKTVIYLYYYEEYSIKEISKILKVNESTIGTRLSRGKTILENKLKGEWNDEK